MFKVCLPQRTVRNPDDIRSFVLSCLVVFILLFAAEVRASQEVSSKEVKELIPAIEDLEKRLLKVYVESESWSESRMKPADPWKKTAYYITGNSWLSGLSCDKMLPTSKMRLDVLKETMGKKGGESVSTELSYSVGYNGLIGKKVNKTLKRGNDIKYLKEAELVTAGYPKELNSRILNSLSGKRFSMHFFFSKETYRNFSGFLRLATSETVVAKKLPLKFTKENFLGFDCLKIEYADDTRNSISWWFEPEKGYALRGYKLVNSINDEVEDLWLVSFVTVTKLQKVGENTWYPIEAFEEHGPSKEGDPYRRFVYRASKIIANAPDFDEKKFDIDIPKDYKTRCRDCKGD